MQINRINDRRLPGVSIKVGIAVLFLLAVVVATLLAHAATEKRQATGDVLAELCESDGHGGWKVIDRFKASLNFEISLADAAAGKTVDIRHVWNGSSEKGCQGSVAWEQPTDLHWDLTSGKLDLITPYVLTVNGHTIRIPISCTTESINTPLGTLNGRRATVKDGTVSAGIVGIANFKAPRKLFQCSGNHKKTEDDDDESFVLVFRGNGKAKVE